jgi:hypothetical protein
LICTNVPAWHITRGTWKPPFFDKD